MATITKASDQDVDTQVTAAEFLELSGHVGTDCRYGVCETDRGEAPVAGEPGHRCAGREAPARDRDERSTTVVRAIEGIVEEVRRAKQVWLGHWEKSAVHVAVCIAERVLRRTLPYHPEVSVTLVREALELAAGTEQIHVYLSPADHQFLGQRVELLAKQLGNMAAVEVTTDAAISPGGCRVETRHGVIDQQFETQLARIEEELTPPKNE